MEKTIAPKTKAVRYEGLDILKLICTVFVVAAHTHIPGDGDHYIRAFSSVTKAVFILITAFFYQNAIDKKKEIVQIKKIFALTVGANVVLFIWKVIYCVLAGNDLIEYLKTVFGLKSLFKFLVLNESPFGPQLWYLGGILYTLIIVYIVRRLNLMKLLMGISPFLFIANYILTQMNVNHFLIRNFLFTSIPYFCLGLMLYKYREKLLDKLLLNSILTAVFSTTMSVEVYLLMHFNMKYRRDDYISTFFLSIAVFLFYIDFYNSKKINAFEKKIAKFGREISMEIYVIHTAFIVIAEYVAKCLGVYDFYAYIAPIVVYALSLIACIIYKKCMQLINDKKKAAAAAKTKAE